jgi:hypothetical protein
MVIFGISWGPIVSLTRVHHSQFGACSLKMALYSFFACSSLGQCLQRSSHRVYAAKASHTAPFPIGLGISLVSIEHSDDEILQAVADEACSFTTVGLITPVLVQRTGYGAFAFFAVWCFLSMIWVVSCTSPPTSTM